ncbi:helix-turn-helix domain-containing protein [Thermasporomyces composti]|jgi:tetratricopeptide (TPR) repeat protein|nr:helix-turn-helix domain-containing protein [Thermasporomyces composti]
MGPEFWSTPEMQRARETRDMGAVSVAYRTHPAHGRIIPQEWVASWVGITQAQVSRIEHGRNRVRTLDALASWAEALRMPADYAWFDITYKPPPTKPTKSTSAPKPLTPRPLTPRPLTPRPLTQHATGDRHGTARQRGPLQATRHSVGRDTDSFGEDNDMHRRTLLGLSLVGIPASQSESWDRLARVLDRSTTLDLASVEHLERRTAELFRREETVPARELTPALNDHLRRLGRILKGSVPSALEGRLLSTVGESLALYGWLAFDRGDYASALRWYDKAAAAARKAGDGPLLACVLTYRSYLEEAAGRLTQARDVLIEAEGMARGRSHAATRSWIAARLAECQAGLREEAEALRALERATTAFDYAEPEQERVWTRFYNGSRLGSLTVTTYVRLRHRGLESVADQVISALPDTDAKVKAIILADVATAQIYRQQYERGAELAHEALDVTLAQEASLGSRRLRELHQLIAPRRDVAVLSDLSARLATLV